LKGKSIRIRRSIGDITLRSNHRPCLFDIVPQRTIVAMCDVVDLICTSPFGKCKKRIRSICGIEIIPVLRY